MALLPPRCLTGEDANTRRNKKARDEGKVDKPRAPNYAEVAFTMALMLAQGTGGTYAAGVVTVKDIVMNAVTTLLMQSVDSAGVRGDRDELGALLALCAQGDQVAFASLYDAMAGRIYGLSVRVLRDHHWAEDATHESFIAVWRCANRFDPSKGSAYARIFTIAHRTAVDRVRSMPGRFCQINVSRWGSRACLVVGFRRSGRWFHVRIENAEHDDGSSACSPRASRSHIARRRSSARRAC